MLPALARTTVRASSGEQLGRRKPWGIRRFSVLDPSGARVTVLAHLDGAG